MKQNNDATLNKLGDIYQYYIALLECFKMGIGDKVQIEIQGDITLISDGTSSFQKEVKHHLGDEAISNRSKDFWNTLKNWVENYNSSMKFKDLILFTTSDVSPKSIFYGWNEMNKSDKCQALLKEGQVNKKAEVQFRKYYNSIFETNINKSKVEDILDKVSIEFLQPKISVVAKKFDKYLKVIPEYNRETFIAALLGWVMNQVVYPPYKWQIEYEPFEKYIQSIAQQFIATKTPLPNIYKDMNPNENEEKAMSEKVFVKELKRIDYEDAIPKAVLEYWRATKTIIDYFSNDIIKIQSVKDYQTDLQSRMEYAKDEIKSEKEVYTRQEELSGSRRLCAKVLGGSAENFGTIIENQLFFKNGIVHTIVDDKKFVWDIGDDNEY